MFLEPHNFYFKNIPHKKFFKKHSIELNSTFLKDSDATTIVYTGNGNFNLPKFFKKVLDTKTIQHINKKGLEIYFYEPMCFYLKGQPHNRSFYTEFSHSDDLNNIRADELDSVEKLISEYSFNNVKVFTCDYNADKLLGHHYSFDIYCKDLFISDIKRDGIARLLQYKNIEKPFWCANGRYTFSRELLMSYLINYKGTYTWHFTQDTNLLNDNVWVEWSKISKEIKEKLITGSKLLNNNYFFIDCKLDTRENIKNQNNVYIPPVNSYDHTNYEFVKSYQSSFVAIINETRYAQPTANFSEKTLQCIGSATPFILFAPPKTLEYIKTLGFKTFSDFWNEDYDNIENHTERFVAITTLIDRISKLSVSELQKMYNDMQDILEHNFLNLENLI